MKLTGHKTEGEHQKYTHHEMENLRVAVKKNPVRGFEVIRKLKIALRECRGLAAVQGCAWGG